MTKLLIIYALICNIILLQTGCALNSGDKLKEIQISQVNANIINVDNSLEKQSNNLTENDIKGIIQELSGKIRLAPLTKTERDGFELRLWINLGMPGDEKLLILRTSESDNQAYFYHLQSKVESSSGFYKEVLANPENGWNNLLSEISNRLASPKRLSLDPQFHLARHEGLISLEAVERGDYQFVFYGQHSSFDDAIRIVSLCKYLSGEFKVNIDCRGERTTLGPIR